MLLNVDNSVILAFCWGPPPTSCQNWSVFPSSHTKNLAAPGRLHFGIFSLFGGSFLLLVATSKEQFLMRHKKKRYLPWKCGLPRSKLYCATRRNATKRGQFCHFGLLLASSWGPPTRCQKWSVFPSSHTKNLAAPGPPPFWNFSPSWSFWPPPRSNS